MTIKTRTIPSFDPYDVKTELVTLADSYFQVGNLDTYESGWLGYFIQSLTFLTSDMLFQNAMAYNEAFLTRALLPSSVYNIATQLDYKIKDAIPASGNFNMIIQLNPLDMLIKIPVGSRIMAGDIPYKTKYTYYVNKTDDLIEITASNPDTGKLFNVPYTIELHEKTLCLVFNIEMWQIETYYHEFTIENPSLYVFYEEAMTGYEGDIFDIMVSVDNERYHELSSIYQALSDERAYEIILDSSNNSFITKLGNGIYGYLPKDQSIGYIRLRTTLGVNGHILKEKAEFQDKLINSLTGEAVATLGTNNTAITNGYSGESLDEIKRHVIENISSAKRLVTEKDYKGFQGVTGLTNLTALPILNRRDIVGNHIPIYIVKMDSENKPIPMNSIPVEIDDYGSDINKGTVITYNNVNYTIPFTLRVDSSYDYLIGRYIYNVTNADITPKLFVKSDKPDVLCGIRQLQARIYPNADGISFNLDAYKLKEMDGSLLTAKLYISGIADPIEAVFMKEYDDSNTVILSTQVVDSTTIATGKFIWTVELYYDSELYNTYKGSIILFYNDVPIATNTSIPVSNTVSPNSFLSCYNMYFITSEDTCQFKVELHKLLPTDTEGNTIDINKIYPRLEISGKTLPLVFKSFNNDTYTYETALTALDEIETGALNWAVYVDYDNDYYNEYRGTTILLEPGRRFFAEIINKDPELIGSPLIELVKIGLATIKVTSNPINGDYTFQIEVSKLPRNSPDKIAANLHISANIYALAYVGETQDQTVILKSPPIPSSAIGEGSITFKIELIYDGEVLDTYKQAYIFQTDLTPICFSNIKRNNAGVLTAYNVPVIKTEYYNDNINTIDATILGELASYRETFTETKMLTDRIIVKFANTYGKSKNMLLNKYYPSSEMVYGDTFEIEIPPKIDVDVFISRTCGTSVPVIVEECKNVLYTFLTLKSDFHRNIYRSELARFLHDVVDEVEFCQVNEPTDDIVYDFSLDYIPKSQKETLFKYCPEYIWFDKDKITINVKMVN